MNAIVKIILLFVCVEGRDLCLSPSTSVVYVLEEPLNSIILNYAHLH